NIPASWSKSGNLEIVINGGLSEQGQVETAAHEIYGHRAAAMKNIDPNHNITPGIGEANVELRNWIVDRVTEALSNYKN
ncbi:MAG: hypothetical protein AAFW00_28230, partial [Bacteroidota bacterium]